MLHISHINTQINLLRTFIVIKYGIIFYVTLPNSGEIFTLGKKIITIMAGAQAITSCRSLFKQLEHLSVPCQFIYIFLNELHYKK